MMECSDFHRTKLMGSRAPLVDRGSISPKDPFRTVCNSGKREGSSFLFFPV